MMPMLMVNPNLDLLPSFYTACNEVAQAWTQVLSTPAAVLPSTTVLNTFFEMIALCAHHHFRSFQFQAPACVRALITVVGALWTRHSAAPVSHSSLVAANKCVLTVLHLGEDTYYQQIIQERLFVTILGSFTDGNNLLSSSILTLLHTVLQQNLDSLILHIAGSWFDEPRSSSPHLANQASFVQTLYMTAESRIRNERQSV
eukprot:NODE_1447_length_1330_cov_69.231920_g1434_i0.p2 GENE.NODE_1447_length_1330_cov_69.231920_g1434_i0~~NODE_1447_length_1330_cov_69.231920_g1434_i0.p2  ORF type:complete len:201 (-),score=46.17 NODE_1447_length_1330_cov_69.231920_g1434_i0:294-896(-)